jgi:hypothetical protein
MSYVCVFLPHPCFACLYLLKVIPPAVLKEELKVRRLALSIPQLVQIARVRTHLGAWISDPYLSTVREPLIFVSKIILRCYKRIEENTNEGHVPNHYIVTCWGCVWLIRRILDWMTVFIEILYTQLGTTGNTGLSLFPHFIVHRYTRTRILSLH